LLVICQKLIGLLKRSRIYDSEGAVGILVEIRPSQKSTLVFSEQPLVFWTVSLHTAGPGATLFLAF
jgi:hypothetical protein